MKKRGLGSLGVSFSPQALAYIASFADGDVRVALASLETTAVYAGGENQEAPETNPVVITLGHVEAAVQKKALYYDKSGEEHFNLISAFHKSLRGK